MKKIKREIPFDFVLEALADLSPHVKPMFGCYAVYIGNKIIMILRNRTQSSEDNGVWLATALEHHNSLQKEFPNMRSIKIFGSGTTNWQNLPVEADDFEASVLRACDLVLAEDKRIGKIPKIKMKKK